jgi:lipopolysaccharide export system permease protein
MRLLDRYLLRELSIPLIYCLAGFTIFWVSFDIFGSLDDFQAAKMTAGDVLDYYVFKLPEMLSTTLPIALLLAFLYTLSNHGRHNEIIAMRAAGLSMARISLPYIAVGFGLSIVVLLVNEKVLTDGAERAEAVKTRHLKIASEKKDWEYRVNFRNAREDHIWNIAAFNLRTYEMVEPHVEWKLPDGSFRQIIAQSGIRTNDEWVFRKVALFIYPPKIDFNQDTSPVLTNEIAVPELTETPSEIKAQIRFDKLNAFEAAKRPQFTLKEIRYLQSHLELNRMDRAKLNTQFHMRLSQPWTCLVVALIALPFGARSNSRRNVFVGAASSIFICFAYFVVLRVGSAMGTGGYVPPWLAAWSPNALFAAVGLWLTWKTR